MNSCPPGTAGPAPALLPFSDRGEKRCPVRKKGEPGGPLWRTRTDFPDRGQNDRLPPSQATLQEKGLYRRKPPTPNPCPEITAHFSLLPRKSQPAEKTGKLLNTGRGGNLHLSPQTPPPPDPLSWSTNPTHTDRLPHWQGPMQNENAEPLV